MEHLTIAEINAYIQHKYGNDEFFDREMYDFDKLETHIKTCISCKQRLERSEKHYVEISALNEPSLVKKYIFSAAAVILIALMFPFLTENTLNETAFISYKEFGFTIHRGNSAPSEELKNELTYLLNEGFFTKAIELCEKEKQTTNNLHYFSALIMRGQKNRDKSDIQLAINSITSDSLSVWKEQAEKIIREKK